MGGRVRWKGDKKREWERERVRLKGDRKKRETETERVGERE